MREKQVARNIPFDYSNYSSSEIKEPTIFDGLNYMNYSKFDIIRMYATLYDSYKQTYMSTITPTIKKDILPVIVNNKENMELVQRFEEQRNNYNRKNKWQNHI